MVNGLSHDLQESEAGSVHSMKFYRGPFSFDFR